MPNVNTAKSQRVDFLYSMRHSCAHLLAAAVQKLYPNAKFGVGPVIENGFYYDIDVGDSPISVDDFPKIEGEMEMLKRQKLRFDRQELSIAEAIEFFKNANQPFKVELLNDIKKYGTTVFREIENANEEIEQEIIGAVSLYKTGEFVDLCRGPHVKDTSEIGHYKLMSVAGAYWRGNPENAMLTRVYGVAFESKAELEQYLAMIEEAKKRDHRKLGKELELFMISQSVGGGLPLFLPKGLVLRKALEDWIVEEKKKRGYQFVWTPHIAKSDLYRQSGHWQKYDAMFNPMKIDDDEYVLKPMNCPHHFQMYLEKPRSYRDLPLRFAENATVYRYEKAGELNGLLRVRSLTQDDTHTFVRESQIEEEIDRVLEFATMVYTTFGFDSFTARISVRDAKRPENYLGESSVWHRAENALVKAVQNRGMEYFVGEGEAAFYGPKIDVTVKDALGRLWQLTTVQLDFNQPVNFDMNCINEKGEKERIAVLHIAVLGSVERFLGIVIEHFAGAFPVWLSPVQVVLATVADSFNEFARGLAAELSSQGIRVEVDDANETVGSKIRKASSQKIPYTLVIGEKEASGQPFMVRERGVDQHYSLSKEEFIEKVKKQIRGRSNS